MTPVQNERLYVASAFWKASTTFCAVVLVGIAGGGMWAAIAGSDQQWRGLAIWIAFSALFMLFSAGSLLWVFRFQLQLRTDSLAIRGLFRTKVVWLEQLKGWRIRPTSPSTLVLEMKDAATRPTKVSMVFRVDDPLYEWLSEVPELDAEETARSAEEILHDERFGLTQDERVQNFEASAKLVKIFSLTSGALCFWSIFYPQPYAFLMIALMVLPWVAVEIARRSNGLIRMDAKPNDPHPNVAWPFLFPAIVLALRAVLDYDLLDARRVMLWSVLFSLVLLFAVVKADPTVRTKVGTLVTISVFILVYGYGATAELNGMGESKPPVSYACSVKGKRVDNGKHTSYMVVLGPWGPKAASNEIEVSKAHYAEVQVGSRGIVDVRTGWLGVRWYSLRRED